jgi:hypothetical protein
MTNNKNGKVYFARFTNKETGEVDFYKFGHTSSYDAMDRFTYDPDQYSKWDIKIMKTVYGPLEQMKGIEQTLRAFYPKNLWVEEKISGVTEIVKLDQTQINKIIGIMNTLSSFYYMDRERSKSEI